MGKLDVNIATREELERIHGIGEARAREILRQQQQALATPSPELQPAAQPVTPPAAQPAPVRTALCSSATEAYHSGIS